MCCDAVALKRGCAFNPVPTAVAPNASSWSGSRRGAHARERAIQLRDPPADHLAERDRHRVLQVGAADHHDVGIGTRLGVERVAQAVTAGISRWTMPSTVTTCITTGKPSFDDWPLLT